MIESLKLPLEFDAQALQGDLCEIPEDHWIPHFNTQDYEGAWSGVALRGPADAQHPIQSLVCHPGITDWADTDIMELCPYLRHALSQFDCPLLSVRLLSLAPDAIIKEHIDDSLSAEDHDLRLHIPIQTNPDVKFMINGTRVPLATGETWYLNVNLPHSVANQGTEARVHLVFDCVVNEWLREKLNESEPYPPESAIECTTPIDQQPRL